MPHRLSLPPLATVHVRVKYPGDDATVRSFGLKVYCHLLDPPAERVPFGGASDDRVTAEIVMSAYPQCMDVGGSAFELPAVGLYRIAGASDSHEVAPTDYVLRPPASVEFELVQPLAVPKLELTEAGRRAGVAGELFVLQRFGSSNSVTRIRLAGGIAFIPAGRMQSALDSTFLTVLLEDGRLLEGSLAEFSWDDARKTISRDMATARTALRVQTGVDTDPKLILGRCWDHSPFPVNGGASIGEPGCACYVRSGSALSLHRLPGQWAMLRLVYADGSVIAVERFDHEVRTSMVERVRALEVDFAKSVKPLVAEHGRALVKFELQADSYADTLVAVVDLVAVDLPGDCDGKVWRKDLVAGARGEIVVEVPGRRIVLAR